MNPTEPDKTERQAPEERAESRAVHGLLSLLGPGEPEAIDARVDHALAAIDRMEAKASSRRRLIPATLVASLAGIAAMIVLLVVIYPRTESIALAQSEITTLVEKMKANTDRWYFIEVGRPEPGTRRGLHGELYVTGDGRFVAFTYHRGPDRRPGPVIGDDGDGIWILPPNGKRVPSQAIPRMLSDIMPRVAEGGFDPAELLQLTRQDWTLTRRVIYPGGKRVIRIEAISPPLAMPAPPRGLPNPNGPHRDHDGPPDASWNRDVTRQPGSHNRHIERLLIDIDPETQEFLRLEVSRNIDGTDVPGAYMQFIRDNGPHAPPGMSPDAYRPGGPPRGPRDRPNEDWMRHEGPPPGRGAGPGFRSDPF